MAPFFIDLSVQIATLDDHRAICHLFVDLKIVRTLQCAPGHAGIFIARYWIL